MLSIYLKRILLSINSKDISLYIHWPYCLKKCPYCDFNSHVSSRPIESDEWEQAYKNEIDNEQNKLGKRIVKSIFFGGGTPSLMSPNLVESILKHIEKHWGFSDSIEITVEANPSSVEVKNFKSLNEAGVNRLSLGLQSLDNNSLNFLGRNHSVKDSLKALDVAKKYFNRVSFDLIYGLPNQNEKTWQAELTKAIKISGEHISAYQLTIEKGTPFFTDFRDKKFDLPPENILLNLYKITDELLNNAQLKKYEVSNYARKNAKCDHNLRVWQGAEYCGIGPGAHGRIIIDKKWFATHKYSSPKVWLNKSLEKKSTLYKNIEISPIERAQEILLTGLRINNGINIGELFAKLQIDNSDLILDKKEVVNLKKLNLITAEDAILKVTKKGFPVLNYIINKLII
jgi:putative oxygen-independent coproporphyrinogen III oxidase